MAGAAAGNASCATTAGSGTNLCAHCDAYNAALRAIHAANRAAAAAAAAEAERAAAAESMDHQTTVPGQVSGGRETVVGPALPIVVAGWLLSGVRWD